MRILLDINIFLDIAFARPGQAASAALSPEAFLEQAEGIR